MEGKNIIVQTIKEHYTEESVMPPPSDIKTSFLSLQDWLFSVCNGEKPDKTITEYSLGLFESKDENVIYIVGLYIKDNRSIINFEPSNMYYLLPNEDYKDLTIEQLKNKLTNQVVDFINTKTFNKSFLANTIIKTNWNGQIISPK